MFLDSVLDGRGQPVAGPDGAPPRFEADGEVRLLGTTIGGQLNCQGGRFTNKDGVALAADRATVTGGVFLDLALDGRGEPVADRDGQPLRFEADGEVRLLGTTVGGQLNCQGGRFTNKDGDALSADGANVTGSVFLDLAVDGQGRPVADRDGVPLRFEADGTVRLVGASIGGQLSCQGGRFTNAEGTAAPAGVSP